MDDILNQYYVLVVNSYYVPIGVVSIKKALTNLFSTADSENMASEAFDLEYPPTISGEPDFDHPTYSIPVTIEKWITLPVRKFDIPIHTAKTIIRAPIVIRAKNYEGMAMRELKLNKRNAYKHYGGKCIWTGRKLTIHEASLEHIRPRSRGGKDEWENIGLAHKNVNSERGDTPVEKWKYKMQYKPSKPRARTAASMILDIVRPEWKYFLIR